MAKKAQRIIAFEELQGKSVVPREQLAKQIRKRMPEASEELILNLAEVAESPSLFQSFLGRLNLNSGTDFTSALDSIVYYVARGGEERFLRLLRREEWKRISQVESQQRLEASESEDTRKIRIVDTPLADVEPDRQAANSTTSEGSEQSVEHDPSTEESVVTESPGNPLGRIERRKGETDRRRLSERRHLTVAVAKNRRFGTDRRRSKGRRATDERL